MSCSRLLLSGLLALAIASPALAQHRLPARIGLQLYSVRDDCARDFEGTLKAVAAMGYSGVEFAGYFGHSAEELRKWLDQDHLTCYGTHLGLGDLSDANFDKTIAFNKVLGNHLLVVASLPGDMTSSHEALLKTAKMMDDLAEKIEASGMLFGYHDHGGDFRMIDGELEWLTLFKNTKKLKIQFDIGHALERGLQAEPLVAQFPGRLISVHLTDFSTTKDKWLLGEGEEQYNVLIPYLRSRNGPRWFIVEQETYPFSPLESSQKSLENFKRMWQTE